VARMRVDKKSRGSVDQPVVGRPLRVGSEKRIFFNFQVKKAGFYAHLLRKTILVARNRDWGDLIDRAGG